MAKFATFCMTPSTSGAISFLDKIALKKRRKRQTGAVVISLCMLWSAFVCLCASPPLLCACVCHNIHVGCLVLLDQKSETCFHFLADTSELHTVYRVLIPFSKDCVKLWLLCGQFSYSLVKLINSLVQILLETIGKFKPFLLHTKKTNIQVFFWCKMQHKLLRYGCALPSNVPTNHQTHIKHSSEHNVLTY